VLEDDEATLIALGLDSGDRTIAVVMRDGFRGGDHVYTIGRDVGCFTRPVGMCVSKSGDLFVADVGARRGFRPGIRVLRASDGVHMRSYEWPVEDNDDDDDDDDGCGGSTCCPSFVCLSPDEEFVIAVEQTAGRHVRVVRAADCALIRSFPILDTISPAGVCMSPDGRLLYISDDVNHHAVFVVRLDDGRLVRMIGSRGDGDGEFDSPTGMCLTPDGELMYVADRNNHRVQVIRTSDGEHVQTFGTAGIRNGSGRFSYPQDVMVSGKWLLVAEYGNHRVQVVSAANGAHETSIAMPTRPDQTRCDFLNRACLSPVGNGQLLVSDSSGCIVVYTA
jgi:sugar lactone lactonase YvrE